jgi:FkbM family methyltransferase
MPAFDALQKTLQLLPVRGKGRFADFLFRIRKPAVLKCYPLPGVAVWLDPNQRIERLMWAGAYERDLIGLFKKILKPGMTVLDVGANIGYFSAIAAGLVEGEGSVHAFEPVPECFARLQRNLADFRWSHVYPCAVADATGTAAIHFHENELGWGSLLGGISLTHAGDVQVIALDDWILRENIRAVHFTKIDAEGGEYRVLQGAAHLLRDLRPVIAAELNSACLSRDHHTPDDVVRLLQSAEYQAFSFNQGVLAIPREADHILSRLRAFTRRPFRESNGPPGTGKG